MRKLVTFSLAFAAGTLLCHYALPLEFLLPAAAVCAVLGLAGLLLRGRRRKRLFLLAAGLALAMVYNFGYISYVRQGVAAFAGGEADLTVTVLDYAEDTGTRCRIPVSIQGAGFLRDRAMYYGDDDLYELEPGDTLSGHFTVSDAASIHDTPITSFTAKGTYYMLYAGGEIDRTANHDRSLSTLPKRLAHATAETIDTVFSQNTAAFLKAILLGDRSGFSDQMESDLGESGLYHITAVSGMHFGFLFLMLAFLVGHHRPRRLAIIAVPVLLLYMLMVGCSASVVRACVMLLFVLAGPLLGRESDSLTSLSAALLLLLLQNPYAIAGVGLQLSFASMFGLLVLAPRIYGLLPNGKHPVWRAVRSSLAASLGTCACTAPLSAIYFNYLPLVGPLANILAIPAASFTFLSGGAATILGFLSPAAARVAAVLPSLGAWYILKVARLLSQIPFHAVYFTNPLLPYWMAYTFALFGYCALTPRGQRKYLTAVCLSAAVLAVAVYLPIRSRQGQLHVVAVDVGQGAGTILSSGGVTALVDCGSSNSYINAGDYCADTLNTYGYFHLEHLILTHYHADHINGIGTLMARMAVSNILVPLPEEADAAYHQELVDLAGDYGCSITYLTADTTYSLGNAQLRVFAPVGDGSTNEEGLSLLCSAGDFDVLITGDMNDSSEAILAETKNLPDIEVLLVGHHGSKNATSSQLLNAVSPEVGIISVGTNSYGHPANSALRRLTGAGTQIYRTDRQGNISIVVP